MGLRIKQVEAHRSFKKFGKESVVEMQIRSFLEYEDKRAYCSQ